jgi:hypothetical protein
MYIGLINQFKIHQDKLSKSRIYVELVDHLVIPSETINLLFIRDEHLKIYRNWSTDWLDHSELVDRFNYQSGSNS